MNVKRWQKKAAASLIALGCVTLFAQPNLAEGAKKKNKKQPDPAPIILEGDEIHYNDRTGEMWVRGHVIAKQRLEQVETELLRGNSKSQDIWVDDRLTFTETGIARLEGEHLAYNYGRREGELHKVHGKVGKEFVTGSRVEFLPDHYVIYDATMTRCAAVVHDKDYKTTAKWVEIWPEDKLIAHEAKFWIKDKIIYTMDKYRKSLRRDEQSEMPQMGYDDDDGFYLKQHLERPIYGDDVSFFADLGFYSNQAQQFKAYYGVIDREERYTARINMGDTADADGRWIKKEPEFRVDFNPVKIGRHMSYSTNAIYGKWTDDAKSSWHQEYNIYFSRNPVRLSKTLTWTNGFGFGLVRESYNNSTQNIFKLNSSLEKEWNEKMRTWVAYNYTRNNSGVFEYQKTDLTREFIAGAYYKADEKNRFSYALSYDLQNNRVYDRDVTWYHNMHCWQMGVTYRVNRQQVKVLVETAKW